MCVTSSAVLGSGAMLVSTYESCVQGSGDAGVGEL
jgi:hypothetical protein